MEYKMILTDEQKSILNGERGETLAKVMETVIRYGELFGADKLVPITSKHNHLVTSFGLKALGPVYELMERLIEDNAISSQTFSMDPRPIDKWVLLRLRPQRDIRSAALQALPARCAVSCIQFQQIQARGCRFLSRTAAAAAGLPSAPR